MLQTLVIINHPILIKKFSVILNKKHYYKLYFYNYSLKFTNFKYNLINFLINFFKGTL